MFRSSMRSRDRRGSWKRETRFAPSSPMPATRFHGSAITSWVWATADFSDVDCQIRFETWIFVDAVLRITPRIAQYPRPIHEIVEAVVGMSMDPEARAAAVDQMLGVRHEARIHERIGKSRVDAPARGRMVGDDHGCPVIGLGQLALEPCGVALEQPSRSFWRERRFAQVNPAEIAHEALRFAHRRRALLAFAEEQEIRPQRGSQKAHAFDGDFVLVKNVNVGAGTQPPELGHGARNAAAEIGRASCRE